MTLTTVSATKDYLGITDSTSDSVLSSLLDYADKIIKNYLNRSIEYSTQVVRLRPDGDECTFFLDYPMVTASGVTVTHSSTSLGSVTTYSEGTDYALDSDLGIIEFNQELDASLYDYYNVSYTSGYGTVPKDLEFACIRIVSGMFKSGGGGNSEGIGSGKEVTSERLGDYSVTYEDKFNMGTATNSINQFMENEKAILNMYKNTHV